MQKKKITMLAPIAKSYEFIKKVVKKTKERASFLYDEVESIIKSQLITLEDKNLLYSMDLESLSKVITTNVIKKLPNVDEEEVNKIMASTSKSFLDILTKGYEKKDYTTKPKVLFKRILIANRGEIALRVIRACKELGIGTVVIYTKSDKNSLAVKFADKAYCIGFKASEYLNIKKIIKIAKRSGAEAIHPGYGFLAENPEFARLCKKNRIKFIGPSPKAIEIMGNKVKARALVKRMGIPVVEGCEKPLSLKEAKKLAKNIGYPIILKAAAGGGGKGMRIIYKENELEDAFNSASREAELAFGDNSLYIEKYIEGARHIEFQILADQYGNIVHLGERDCSIQRRHQKLIEESPSPALTSGLRAKIGDAAIKAVKAVGYEGAGTVEFLLDKDNNYYFMEMNTRIQVEHGVTEMVTGVDLVKEQIKIAAGAELAYTQKDIKINGWAIECRINAESPINNFTPSTGVITNYLPPGGPGIRVCSCSHVGHVITPQYDSMISKLICRGETREEAIARMKRALDEYIIEGVETTIPFHKVVMNNKNFIKGNITIDFIEKNKIIEKLKKVGKRKVLKEKEKVLLITTAVAHYLSDKKPVSPWVIAGRQEAINKEF